ncbi:MAG TPA: MATE family efflux transporter [Gemmatimonadaceae bacterium]|nr:MATE family efflux transporter [Gemmatimonadaceae bacterium]
MSQARDADEAVPRPPEHAPAAALPFEAHDGAAPVAVASPARASDIVTDPLSQVIRRLALPAVASNVLMTVFASVDAFWVGTRIGARGLAAVSTAVFWIWMVIALAEMVSVGLTAVAARRHGENRPEEAARVVGEAMSFALALGAVVGIAGALSVDHLFALMHTPPEVTALGRHYLRIYFLGSPLIYGYFAVDAAFRAAGDTRTPFVLLLATTACTLALDPVLILGLGGAPRLGIAGAAIALVLTRGGAFLIGFVLLTRRGLLRVRPVSLTTLASIARVGLPTALTGITFSLIYVALTRTTTQFGTPALAALGLGHRVESWLYTIGVGFGAAAAAIVGQNLGAGRPDRAERAGWITLGYSSIPALLASVAAVLIPERLAGLFTTDVAVLNVAVHYLRISAVAELTVCAEIVLEGALGGAGHTVPPMLTSTALTALRIPVAWWAAARWGVDGIWWTISLTAAARGLAMIALWRAGGWKHKSV